MTGAARVALDTSAYVHLRGGDQRVADAIAAARVVSVPVTVLGELEAAFELGTRPADNRARLAELLAAPFVSVLPITTDVSRVYGRLFAQLKRAGTPVGVNEIWIAASAIDSGCQLLTFDADFRRIPALDLHLLTPMA